MVLKLLQDIKMALIIWQSSLAPYRRFGPFTQASGSLDSIFTDLTKCGEIKPSELVWEVLGEV